MYEAPLRLDSPAASNYHAAFSSAGQVFSLWPLAPPATHTVTYYRQTRHVRTRPEWTKHISFSLKNKSRKLFTFYFNMFSSKLFGLTLRDYFKNGRARLKQLINVERAKIFSWGGREERLADFYTGFIVPAPRKASFVLVTSQVVLTPW